MNTSLWLTAGTEPTGASESELREIFETISINGGIRAGELRLSWKYSTAHFEEDTIKILAGNYQDNLKKLIVYCIAQAGKDAVYTPSDYGLESDITYQELDKFLGEDDTDDIMSF